MAGKIKHKERSRKTRNRNYAEYDRFKKNAFVKQEAYQKKLTLAERFKNLFDRNKDK